MVIPDRDPRKCLVAQEKIEIRSVARNTLAIIIKSVNSFIRQWYATDALTLTVFSVLVFVNIITKVEYIVDRSFAGRITICVEKPKREVAARIDRKAYPGRQIARSRCCLGTADWTRYIRAADAELIIVASEGI